MLEFYLLEILSLLISIFVLRICYVVWYNERHKNSFYLNQETLKMEPAEKKTIFPGLKED